MRELQESILLAPLEIWEVPLDEHTVIKFHEPLVLTPTWMPDDPDEPSDEEYLDVICPELNIDVYADNRDDLLEVVKFDIQFIWKNIVLQPDNVLSKRARKIKRNHLAIAEVVDG